MIDASSRLNVRPATLGDRKALWQWRSDTMHFRLYPNNPVSWDNHCQWFQELLDGDDRVLLIGTVNTLRVGAILFCRNRSDVWEGCMIVKPLYLAKGIGGELLRSGSAFLKNEYDADVVDISEALNGLRQSA